MLLSRYPVLLPFLCLLLACETETQTPSTPLSGKIMLNLKPLSPYTHEFTTQNNKNRNNYFFSNPINWQDILFRTELQKQLEAIKAQSPRGYVLFSVYVYNHTDVLNAHFNGTADSLSGIYDNDLISYARWNQDKLDIFYLIDSGNVVYDMLKKRNVSPPWEFD